MKNKPILSVIVFLLFSLCILTAAAGAADENVLLAGDPFTRIVFNEESGEAALDAEGNLEEIKLQYSDNGLLITGKNQYVKDLRLTLKEPLDFGAQDESPVIRVMVDALAKTACNISVRLFLDDETEPFACRQLSLQEAKDDWSRQAPVFIELPESISGMHRLSVAFDDRSTTDSKKTKILLRGIRFYRESLPVIFVDIDESLGTVADMNASPDHHTRCYGSVSIRVPEGYESVYSEEGLTSYSGGTYKLDYIRGRGNSTWERPKKPYKVKLEEAANLFGMGTNDSWALMAGYLDRSFVRNSLTYYLGEALHMPATPKLVPVEVVINGNYQGLYFLSETIEIGKNRLEIDDLEDISPEEEDITGGYLLRMKWQGEEYTEYTFRTGEAGWVLASPDELKDKDVPDERLEEMRAYITDYVWALENALYGEDFRDENGVPYTEYMDLESAVKYFLIQELSQNGDGYYSDSTYVYKPRKDRLFWGPLWDFDYAAWGAKADHAYSVDEETARAITSGFTVQFPWILRMREDPAFTDMVKKIWGGIGLKDPDTLAFRLEELYRDGGLLDEWEEELSAAADNNADIPGFSADLVDDYNVREEELESALKVSDFHGEIERLKRWIRFRTEWFDENLDSLQITDAYAEVVYEDEGRIIGTEKVYKKAPLNDLPVPESRDGQYFAGWYTDVTYVSYLDGFPMENELKGRFRPGSFVPVDLTMTAKWVGEEEVPEAVFFAEGELYLNEGSQTFARISTLPEDRCDVLSFSSSDSSVAAVDARGCITGMKTGDAVITAATVNGLTAECVVHVLPEEEFRSEVFDFAADEENLSLAAGSYKRIDIHIEPENAETPKFRFLVADEDVVSVTPEGIAAAKAPGETVIFVICDGGEAAAKIHVTVTE